MITCRELITNNALPELPAYQEGTMTTRSKSATFNCVSAWSLGTLVIFASLMSNALVSGPAQALPPSGAKCAITTYYSDPAKTQKVGTFSTCPGKKRGLTGKKTKYYEVENFDLGKSGPGHTGPGSLPCEFLEEGCGNLPKPRN